MGRKKRRGVEFKPFCFYCDRDFDDEKVLIQHQKAKHFKCSECNRKLDTATGLVVHMLHVHKDTISRVPNAIQGRDNPEFIVHGMEGVPQDVINEKQQKTIDEKGLAKHMKSAHTVFGMGVMSGLGLIPEGIGADMLNAIPPVGMPNQMAPNQFAQFPGPQRQGQQGAVAQGQVPAPPLAPAVTAPIRHSGIAIHSGLNITPPAPTPAAVAAHGPTPTVPSLLTAPQVGPSAPQAQSKILVVYSEDQISMEEMVATAKHGYKAG